MRTVSGLRQGRREVNYSYGKQQNAVTGVDFSPNSSHVVLVALDNGTSSIWDIATRERVLFLEVLIYIYLPCTLVGTPTYVPRPLIVLLSESVDSDSPHARREVCY